ncbi:MAG: tail fiber domain-containing protein [Bacteriovoracaceae bacterium]
MNLRFIFLFILSFINITFASNEHAQTVTYQGRLLNAARTAAITEPVTFKFQIYNPAGTCLLYEETQSTDLTNTSGAYSLKIGSFTGDAKRTAGVDPGLSMSAVFNNDTTNQTRAAGANCAAGYTPVAGDSRLLKVTITPSSTGTPETLSPNQYIKSASQATVAETLMGLTPTDFVQKDPVYVTNDNIKILFSSLTGGVVDATSLHTHDDRYVQLSSSSAQDFGSGGFNTTGNSSIGSSSNFTNTTLSLKTTANNNSALIVKAGGAGQTANLVEIQNSAGSDLLTISSAGEVSSPSFVIASTSGNQLAVKYDSSNTLTLSVASTGGSSFSAAGASPFFSFLNAFFGIGNSSPSKAMHITSSSAPTILQENTLGAGDQKRRYSTTTTSGDLAWGKFSDNMATTTEHMRLLSNGNLGVGVTAPTAKLHLKAGTATASTTPLKFNSGVLLTTPEDGAVEYDGSNYYATASGSRNTFVFAATDTDYGVITNSSGALTVSAGGSNQNIVLAPSGTGSVTTTSATSITNSTASTSSSTGALIVAGGMGITDDLFGGASISSATSFLAPLGSETLPSYTFTGDTNTGLFSPLADILALTTAGSEKIRIDSAGYVGIATTSPVKPLHITSSSAPTYIQENTSAGSDLKRRYVSTNATGDMNWGKYSDDMATTTEHMRLLSNGALGIGVTSPSAMVHLKAGTSTASTAPLKLTSGTLLTTPENGAIEFDGTDYYATASGTRTKLGLMTTAGDMNTVNSISASGALSISAGGTNQNLSLAATGTGKVISTSATQVSDATASTSSSTGSMIITGGMGVGENIFAADNISSSGTFIAPLASQTAPSYAFTGDTNTGIFSSSANYLDITSNGTTQLGFYSNGNIGIGTSNPTGKIEVVGNSSPVSILETSSTFDSSLALDLLRIRTYVGSVSASTGGRLGIKLTDFANSTKAAGIYTTSESSWANSVGLSFYTGNTATSYSEKVRIDASGNLGIGLTNPNYRLDVGGDGSGITALFGADAGASTRTDATTKLANLAFPHHLLAEEPTALISASSSLSSNQISIGGGSALMNSAANVNFLTYANNTTTTGSQRIKIDSSGNVGIGSGSPVSQLSAQLAPTASANYGLVSLGSAPFNGSTSEYYIGNSSGTALAINESSSFAGSLADFHVNGSSEFKVSAAGSVTNAGNLTSTGTVSTNGTTLQLVAANAATNVANQNSPSLSIKGNYWTGAASAQDQFTITNSLGTGSNPTSTLLFDHSGSSGQASYRFNNGYWGISGNPVYRTQINDSTTDTTADVAGSYFELQPTFTTNNSQDHYAVRVSFTPDPPTGVALSTGNFYGNYVVNNFNTASALGTASSSSGIKIDYGIKATAGGGSITNAYGIYIKPLHQAGTITTSYPLYISGPTTGGTNTNEWGIYQESTTAKNVFMGPLGFMITGPSAILHFSGGISTPAWTDNGLNIRVDSGTYTDTTSSGVVSDNYINTIESSTLAASSVTTYTNASSLLINQPKASTNTTATNVAALTVPAKAISNTTNGYGIYVNTSTGAGTNYPAYFNANVGFGTTNPATRVQVGSSGDGTTALANSWTTFSDERLKKNIKVIPESLKKFQPVTGYYYQFKKGIDQKFKIGLKAQEVEKTMPEVVSNDSDGFKSLSYENLVAPIINGIKDLKDLFLTNKSTQQRELASLKAQEAIKQKKIVKLKETNQMLISYLCKKDPKDLVCQR